MELKLIIGEDEQKGLTEYIVLRIKREMWKSLEGEIRAVVRDELKRRGL